MATPPYAHRVNRVTIQGNFASGAEIWTTGFHMGKPGADADLPTQALADEIRTLWATFFTTPGVGVNSMWQSDQVKISSFGTDGKSSPADTVYSPFTTTTKGGATSFFPPQISLVATLQGPDPRGVGAKGRMYLPGISGAIDGTGHLPFGAVTPILNALRTFLQGVNASTNSTDFVINASHGSINKDGTPKIGGSAPVNKAVFSLKVGNVYDTQRRRRNALVETYQTATV
jgi:hypothetical protein